jgi:hypothetical protein
VSTSLDDDLRFAAARYALGVLPGEDIVALARRSVELGRLPGAVCELTTNRDEYPTARELGPLFEGWLAEEGVRVPVREVAVRQVLRGWITRIARSEIAPYDGLSRIMDEIYYGQQLYDETSESVGDSHGIEHLVGDFYGRDDLLDRPDEVSCNGKYGTEALVEFDKIVIEHAGDWLRRHPL